jgi:hypothetical protein
MRLSYSPSKNSQRFNFNVSRVRATTTLAWVFVLATAAWGLSPLMHVPIMQDDFPDLVYGMSVFETKGPLILWSEMIQNSIGTSYVTPVAGTIGFLQFSTIWALASWLNLSFAESWSTLRIVWILVALLASSWALSTWLPSTRIRMPSMQTRLLALFSIQAGIAVATLQVHAPWSNDPVVSYPVAGWASTALGFCYLASLGKALIAVRRQRLWIMVTGVLGMALALSYTMMVSAIIAGLVLATLCTAKTSPMSRHKTAILTATSLPLLTYVIIQFVRLLGPMTYDGTEPGSIGRALQSLPPFIGGSIPLTSLSLASQHQDAVAPVSWIAAPVISSLVLICIGMILVRRSPQSSLATTRSPGQLPLWIFVAGLSTFWFSSSALTALSSRYQVELNAALGRVHMFYAAGALCVTAILTILILAIPRGDFKMTLGILLVVITSLSVMQGAANAHVISALKASFAVNNTVLDTLDSTDAAIEDRCHVLWRFANSGLPDYYWQQVLMGSRKYFLHRFGEPICSEPEVSAGSAVMLAPIIGTYGFEMGVHDQGFFWLKGGESSFQVKEALAPSPESKNIFMISAPPCMKEQLVTLSTRTWHTVMRATNLPKAVVIPLTEVGVSADLSIQTHLGTCQVPGDPREFAVKLAYAGIPYERLLAESIP